MTLISLWLAFIPFVNPIPFPVWERLWMFLPLALCVSIVYRATRARRVDDLLRPTLVTFVNVVLGMVAIAVGLYAVSEAAIRFF